MVVRGLDLPAHWIYTDITVALTALSSPGQCGKLNFWSTRPKTDAPYMFYIRFHSPRRIFYSPSSKFTQIGQGAMSVICAKDTGTGLPTVTEFQYFVKEIRPWVRKFFWILAQITEIFCYFSIIITWKYWNNGKCYWKSWNYDKLLLK